MVAAGSGGERLDRVISELRSLAVGALSRMYLRDKGLFAFRLRRDGDADRLEGTSLRYTATVLIGLAGQSAETIGTALAGDDPHEVCSRLIDGLAGTEDLGEAALTLWAARVWGHRSAGEALGRLREMEPAGGKWPTVEVAWSLSALSAEGDDKSDRDLAAATAGRLMESFHGGAGLFPHWPDSRKVSALRGHICCFADLVYPIQALSMYHLATGDERALAVARQCGGRMCELQGERGQWWWHYDVRTGKVTEGYPVYAVHQDSMAPMALRALQSACGDQFENWIERGVRWLMDPPERQESLVDKQVGVIWRKVSRYEPGKFARTAQAAASRVHGSLRVPGVDRVFRPGKVDWESRPYHMGWILHAWR